MGAGRSVARSTAIMSCVLAVLSACGGGGDSPAASSSTDTTAPSVPIGLTATALSASQIDLAWTASTDDVAVTDYEVERCQDVGCTNFTPVGTPTTTSYSDTSLIANTTYTYRVRTTDAAGNLSGYSAPAAATTQATADTTPPSIPIGLTATAVSASQIDLAWTASTDDVGVTGYEVERCQGVGCTTFTQVGISTTNAYFDTSLTASTAYTYRVRATDAAGNLSGYSAPATATTSGTEESLTASCDAISLTNPMFSSDKPAFTDGGTGVPDIVRDPAVSTPIAAGVSQYVPLTEYPEQNLLQCGFLDATRAPFNADPTGNASSASANTAAINAAMRAAREYMLVTYFPPGTYVVNDQLECIQGLEGSLTNEDRQGACVLMGARTGTARPKIVLADNTPGFGSVGTPRALLHIWARGNNGPGGFLYDEPQPSITFNDMVVGIDLTLGSGNPGAIGVDIRSAQGSGLEDSAIDATGAYIGYIPPGGAGGTSHNVTVIGGQYGIDATDSGGGGAPTASGVTLIGQTERAILYNTLETFSLVGARIVVPSGVTGPAIEGRGASYANGTMSIVDTSIEFESAGASNVAVSTNRSAYLNNVYVRGAGTAVSTSEGDSLAGNATDWRHVREYATVVTPPPHGGTGVQYYVPIYQDGVRQTADYVDLGSDGAAPPSALQSQHQWNESTFPYWDIPGVINIKLPPYNAQGDFSADDTAAIQQAIDDNPDGVIFFPKGYYRVSRTIRMQPNTQLVGTARQLSHIVGFVSGDQFGDPANPAAEPVVESANSTTGTAVLAFLGVYQPHEENTYAYVLNWRTGRNSIIRSINPVSRHTRNSFGSDNAIAQNVPMVLISGSGGGRWYGHFRDMRFQSNWPDSPDFRYLKVDGTTEPLHFYHVNPEGQNESVWTKVEITNASNVNIYGYKDEHWQRALLVNNSNNINLYGLGGTGYARPGETYIEVQNTPNFRLVGLVNRAGNDDDPSSWNMVTERDAAGTVIASSDPLDRPILYKRSE